jgi:RNA polymerase sigma-70 factor (ECF subfamily)
VFRVANKIIRDRDAVADLVQEIFIYMHEKMQEGMEIKYPKSWLYRVTYNKSIDYLRSANKFQSLEESEDYLEENYSEEENEMQLALKMAMSKLKPQEKFLVVLYSEGLPYKELSEITGIKFSSVGKTLARTLKKIEKHLKKQRYEVY